MSSLFSYCIPIDDGVAPNPYWDFCTLAICKPAIRSAATEGDWIAGTGARHAQVGGGGTRDLSGRLVYAMKVTKKFTMKEYDAHTRVHLPDKVPSWRHADHQRRLGDSIYDFSTDPPTQRPGAHQAGNIATDLRGKFVLLSDEFYYFGASAIPLPGELLAIAQNRQGHRRQKNDEYRDSFISWATSLGAKGVLGQPLYNPFRGDSEAAEVGFCAGRRCADDLIDAEDDS